MADLDEAPMVAPGGQDSSNANHDIDETQDFRFLSVFSKYVRSALTRLKT